MLDTMPCDLPTDRRFPRASWPRWACRGSSCWPPCPRESVSSLHPLAWTGLLEQLTEALAGGGHLLPAGAAVLGSVLVQTLPVLVPVAPALGALSFVRETHIPAAWGSDFSMVLPSRFPVTWVFFHSSSLSMGIRLNFR